MNVSPKTQINVRIKQKKKQEWEQAAEDDPRIQGGISGLIRTAVDLYIAEENQPQNQGQTVSTDIPDDLPQRLAAIEDTLGDVHTVINRADQSLEFIEDEIAGTNERPFSDQLLRAIPPAQPQSEQWEDAKETHEGRREGEPVAWEGTIEAFTEQLESDRDMIEASLDALIIQEDEFVETGVVDGERRYWTERHLEYQPYADGRTIDEETKQRGRRNRHRAREQGGSY